MSAAPAKATPALTAEDFHDSIAITALELSRRRKAFGILVIGHEKFLDGLDSSAGEMHADWRNACTVWAESLLSGARSPSGLDPAAYTHIEAIWLDEIKQCIAYCKWVDQSGGGWAGPDQCREHYFQACEELRARLAGEQLKRAPNHHCPALRYIRDSYLNQDGKPDTAKTGTLTARKAARLAGHDPDALATATRFVDAFYGNIVQAVEAGGPAATGAVLRAVRHGGGSPGGPGIVNALEALLLISYLDPATVESCWRPAGGVNRDATF